MSTTVQTRTSESDHALATIQPATTQPDLPDEVLPSGLQTGIIAEALKAALNDRDGEAIIEAHATASALFGPRFADVILRTMCDMQFPETAPKPPVLPADAREAMLVAVEDFMQRPGHPASYLSIEEKDGHIEIRRHALGVSALYAVAVPDKDYAARVTITNRCPLCDPGHTAVPADRYTVEYEIEEI